MLPKMRTLGAVLFDKEDKPVLYYPIDEACIKYPYTVMNLSKLSAPACEVSESEFPVKATQCEEQSARLKKYIAQGFLTCTAAKDMYQKLGCGNLDCK